MGFHLVSQVYENVVGTSPTAQAVLAYLALKADDKGVHKCFPSRDAIAAATHFKHTSITNALNELREANLLEWKRGGRMRGKKGRSLSNEYTFNLPTSRPKSPQDKISEAFGKISDQRPQIESDTGRQTVNGVAAKRPMQLPPDGICTSRQTAYASAAKCPPSSIDHPLDHRSAINDSHAEAEDDVSLFEELFESASGALAQKMNANNGSRPGEVAREGERKKHSVLQILVNMAMEACGDSPSNEKSRGMFASTIQIRDPKDVQEAIHRFKCERREGWYDKANTPAAILNKAIATLPTLADKDKRQKQFSELISKP